MKLIQALQLTASLLLMASPCLADEGRVSIQVAVQKETGQKDVDNNTKTPDASRTHWLAVKVLNTSPAPMEGLTLKWTLFASELQRGADRIVAEKTGEMPLNIPAGQETVLTTSKVIFHWTPQHSERTGSGRRSSAKRVDETGHRYRGYRVQVMQGGQVIGESVSDRSLQDVQ